MTSLLPDLIEILELKETGQNTFVTHSLDIGSLAVYGGQVLAQSVAAAEKTVSSEKSLNSLHGYFLLMGDNSKEIEYKVDVIRDGRSFSTRRVRALQDGKVIYIMASSFHKKEEGPNHQSAMPNVARPDSLTSFSDIFKEFAEKFNIKPKGLYSNESPFIFKPVEHYDPFNPGKRPARSHVWFKLNGQIEPESELMPSLLAYASDFSLLITALLPHELSFFTTPMKIASLDHAMWFHRKVDLNDWCLYAVDSPSFTNARGFCRGSIYSKEGILLASVAQEGLIRLMK